MKINPLIPVIIQARFNSSRFPGKVLAEINGDPLLEYLVLRLKKKFGLSNIIIATSVQDTDNPIADFCLKKKFGLYRGSLNNVAERMLNAARGKKAEGFVRINGDSPMIDPNIILKALKIYEGGDYD